MRMRMMDKTKTIGGPKEKLGDGYMQHFTVFDGDTPQEYFLELDASMVETLTTTFPESGPASDGMYDIYNSAGDLIWPCCGFETALEPFSGKRFKKMPFDHLVSNFNPSGHGPPGIYTVPHFDFHWYIIDNEDRLSVELPKTWEETCGVIEASLFPVPLSCEDRDRSMEPVPADEIQPLHCTPVPGGTAEPAMGNHL
jgi:hypothetical protein